MNQENTALATRTPSPLAMKAGAIETTVQFKDGESMLVKATPEGRFVAAKTWVSLSLAADELWSRYDDGRDPQISAMGYRKMNKFAGYPILHPDTQLTDDGRTVANPYCKYDGNGQLVSVTVTKQTVGLTSAGNVTYRKHTKVFPIGVYLAETLVAKWKAYKDDGSPKKWGSLYRKGSVPKKVKDNPQILLVDIPGGMVLAADLTDNTVIKTVSNNISLTQFAIDRCTTMCERNLLKGIFAVTKPLKGDKGYGVWVGFWQHEARDLEGMAQMIAEAQENPAADIKAVEVTDSGLDEEPIEADEFTPREEEPGHAPGVDVPDEPSANQSNDLLANTRANLRGRIEGMNPGDADTVLQEVGIANGRSGIGVCDDNLLLIKAIDAIDAFKSKGGAA